MVNIEEPPGAVDFVRWLASQGKLKQYADSASEDLRRRLWAGAWGIAWPLVFQRVTRPVERRRGHPMCASAVQRLQPECADRFHDDVEAVLHDLFTNADVPIQNLEGWLTARLRRATIDGHRRRRGGRGAPQRPRVPVWLVKALGADPWLVELAKLVLDWVGVEATAGTEVWPATAWAERRAGATGEHWAGEAAVAADIAAVLAAMKRRPHWYEKNVERPLGRKRAPVWLPSNRTDPTVEPEPLVLVPRHELDDALLNELAAAAIDVVIHRAGCGEDLGRTVRDVLTTVFGTLPAAHDLDRVPGAGPAGPEQVMALIDDPARLDRIIATVEKLLGELTGPGPGTASGDTNAAIPSGSGTGRNGPSERGRPRIRT